MTYAVVYWKGDKMFIAVNRDGSIRTFEQIADADNLASEIETSEVVACRTVSLEGVTE